MNFEQVVTQGFPQTGVASAVEQNLVTQGYGAPGVLPPVQEALFVFFRDRPAERRTLTTLRTR